MKKLLTFLPISFIAATSFGQCPAGQANVTVDVTTDNWGYECYWDLTAAGAGCGVNPIMVFGNTAEVNCTSGGSQVATAGGYADNATVTETIGCLNIGSCFDINYVDDYGDGGATFTVNIDGTALPVFTGTNAGNTFTFCITNYDASVSVMAGEYTMIPLSQAGNIISDAMIASNGLQAVTNASVTVTVTRGGTTVHTASSTPTTVNAGASVPATLTAYTPDAFGSYTVTYTTSIAETDEDVTNNTATFMVNVTDSTYARDNGIKGGQIGIGASEDGYLGNAFTINNTVNLTSISAMIGNTDGSLTGGDLVVEVFATDANGVPTTSIATATTVMTADSNFMYTVPVSPVVSLAAGTYVVCVKENAALQQQVCWSSDVFTAGTVFASWVSQPWDNVENFGFPITFIVRPNLNFGASVETIEQTELVVYPNPATDKLYVSNTNIGSTIEIYNSVGALVASKKANNSLEEISLSSLVDGVYVVKSINKGSVSVAKFIKK